MYHLLNTRIIVCKYCSFSICFLFLLFLTTHYQLLTTIFQSLRNGRERHDRLGKLFFCRINPTKIAAHPHSQTHPEPHQARGHCRRSYEPEPFGLRVCPFRARSERKARGEHPTDDVDHRHLLRHPRIIENGQVNDMPFLH